MGDGSRILELVCTLAFQPTALRILIHEGQCAIMCRESLAVAAGIDGSAEKERTHYCPQICYPPTAAFSPLSSSTCHLTCVPVMSQPTTNIFTLCTVFTPWDGLELLLIAHPILHLCIFLPLIDCLILLFAKRLVCLDSPLRIQICSVFFFM